MKHASRFVAVVGLSLSLLISGGFVHAQQVPIGQGNGMKIAPVRNDLTIDKGTTQTVSLFVENITGSTITLRGIVNDFVASDDESGEPKIILDDNQSAEGNSFKSLVGSISKITLEPNERREVRVNLTVPTDAESGGYYGAVRFAPDNGESSKNVSLTASAGSIFLVRVPGAITEKLSIESFKVTRGDRAASLFNSGPVTVETRFRNFGNIHVQPFGKIIVKNMSGKIIQETEINDTQPRGSVLPGSIRKFKNTITQKKLFGKYTVEASFGYGSNGELLSARKTFYVIPFKLIGLAALLILFLIFAMPRIVRAYNRRVIENAKLDKAQADKKDK